MYSFDLLISFITTVAVNLWYIQWLIVKLLCIALSLPNGRNKEIVPFPRNSEKLQIMRNHQGLKRRGKIIISVEFLKFWNLFRNFPTFYKSFKNFSQNVSKIIRKLDQNFQRVFVE